VLFVYNNNRAVEPRVNIRVCVLFVYNNKCSILYEHIYAVKGYLRIWIRRLFLFDCIKRGRRTTCPQKATDVLFFHETVKFLKKKPLTRCCSEKCWYIFLHFFITFMQTAQWYAKYGYWLPLEWYCIFLEAGSANSISAIVSGKNGKPNNNSFCFMSVSNAFCRYWVVQLNTERHMEEFSLIYYFSASIYTEKLVGIITIKLYCLTDLWNILLFNDKSVAICNMQGTNAFLPDTLEQGTSGVWFIRNSSSEN